MNQPKVKTKSKEAIPLYRRLEYHLRNQILSGQLESGDQIPTQDELVQAYGVSKITVRNALAHLEAEGLIVRSAGRGTFVSEDIPVKKQFIVTGGIYDIVADAKRFEARALDIRKVPVSKTRSPRLIRDFMEYSNDELIGLVRRIRLLEGVAIYFLENYLPSEYVEHLTVEDLNTRPLLNILKEKAGLVISRGEMYIEAVPADPDVADKLQCQVFDPLILMQVYYWFPSGKPFEIVNLYMRHDYFKYKVDLDAKNFEKI